MRISMPRKIENGSDLSESAFFFLLETLWRNIFCELGHKELIVTFTFITSWSVALV